MTMKQWLLIILYLIPLYVSAQKQHWFSGMLKVGGSFGGSQPARFREDKSATLMLDVSGGIGVSAYFYGAWQICVDANFIRKGINCPLAYSPTITGFDVDEGVTPEVYGWFDNAYLEIPFTIGYTWGYGICRTRLGAYYARRLSTNSRLIIDGHLLEEEDQHSATYALYESRLSNHDYGLKIANEFYYNHFSVSLEVSSGFVSSIQSSWRKSISQSYTMAVCLYLGYMF